MLFQCLLFHKWGAYWDAINSASANIWDGADIQAELDACNTAILQ